jgi:hypothetical protein|tara:strand:- start:329 stop:580 length:252 start_codon:yes stop_codon:yes gene_type:complete
MSTRPKAKPLNAAVKKALKKKAEGTRFKYGELAAVYRKGQGAYLGGGSRNVSMAAWAMGRVNSYMRGDKARTVDMAIYKRYRK